MQEQEHKEIIKEECDAWFEQFLHGQTRQNQSSDSFCALLVQIAGMILVLSGIPLSVLKDDLSVLSIILYIIGVISLLISLGFGLWNVHQKEKFWLGVTDIQLSVYKKYRQVRRGKLEEKEVKQFIEGITNNKNSVSSPKWPWKAQVVLLFVGTILTTLSFIFLF